MNGKRIIHIADIPLSPTSGVGRVSWFWKEAFERRGWEFLHLGSEEVPRVPHINLWGYAARREFLARSWNEGILLVHEPIGGLFVGLGLPLIVFSHGLEERFFKEIPKQNRGWKARILGWLARPIWMDRARVRSRGIKRADGLLLITEDDKNYVMKKWGRSNKCFVYRNGVRPTEYVINSQGACPTVLFNGAWQENKGSKLVCQAAHWLLQAGVSVQWTLVGTGGDRESVLAGWEGVLRNSVRVVPRFEANEEAQILAGADVFVLPSYHEGQPLSLLQAMEAGRCCVVSDCRGHRALIRDGVNGRMFRTGDVEDFVRVLKECLVDEAARRRMGLQAREDMRGRSWDEVSDEVVSAVEGFLG